MAGVPRQTALVLFVFSALAGFFIPWYSDYKQQTVELKREIVEMSQFYEETRNKTFQTEVYRYLFTGRRREILERVNVNEVRDCIEQSNSDMTKFKRCVTRKGNTMSFQEIWANAWFAMF